MSGDENPARPSAKRRKLLKNIAAGTIVTLGSGTATATQREAEVAVERKYANRATIEKAVAETALVDSLADEGVLAREDLPALEPSGHERMARRRGSEGVSVQTIVEDDTVHPRISVVAQTDEHAVQLFLRPGRDDYALVETRDGNESFVAEESSGDVHIQGCYDYGGVVCTSGVTCSDVQIRTYERLYCTQFQKCIKGEDLGCKLPPEDCRNCS